MLPGSRAACVVDAAEVRAGEYFIWDDDTAPGGDRAASALAQSSVLTCEQSHTRTIGIIAATKNGDDPTDNVQNGIFTNGLNAKTKSHQAVPQNATDNLSEMAHTLEKSGDYRVLRRLRPREVFTPLAANQQIKIGVLLDVETTGLNTKTDEVIELGMLKFAYCPDGRVARVIDSFGSLNEPANPIPAEITAITGITDEMVAGKQIDAATVSTFVSDANIVIAHNANFDRKFAERYWPEFEHKHWGCSATEIDWRTHGFEGSRLGYLLMGAGLFHAAHRAVDDCHALLEVLAMPLTGTERPALASLLDRARRNTVRIWAEGAPYDLKDELKKRKYRWNDGSDGRPRSWHVEIDEVALDAEMKFLCQEIYRREIELLVQPVSALTRFSDRS